MSLTIALGMKPGLQGAYHNMGAEEELRLIRRMRDRNAKPCRDGLDAMHQIDKMGDDVSEIEIFGAWEQQCVATSVAEAVMKGATAKVPFGFTVRADPRYLSGGDPEYNKYARSSLRECVQYWLKSKGVCLKVCKDDDYLYFSRL